MWQLRNSNQSDIQKHFVELIIFSSQCAQKKRQSSSAWNNQKLVKKEERIGHCILGHGNDFVFNGRARIYF